MVPCPPSGPLVRTQPALPADQRQCHLGRHADRLWSVALRHAASLLELLCVGLQRGRYAPKCYVMPGRDAARIRGKDDGGMRLWRALSSHPPFARRTRPLPAPPGLHNARPSAARGINVCAAGSAWACLLAPPSAGTIGARVHPGSLGCRRPWGKARRDACVSPYDAS